MSPERFRQIRNLFDAALDRDGAARSAFLAEACRGDEPLRAEVERLLSAQQQEAPLLDQPTVRPELLTGEPGRMEGRRIDHFEILRELGRGGMGSVYLAARTDDVYRKPVALKVVRPESGSAEALERFRREREILASLDHPNIARLLDGGTTPEGLPYFVMDYVEGQSIDLYCDEHQMSVTQRLTLFRPVCDAVEYAHRRGVVHRDLKPGNILVSADGVPKLLDFGIAKLLRDEGGEAGETAVFVTRTGMCLMTPEYASPEQVRGEKVGTASDLYSLGVILYELLTGHRPYPMRSRLIHEVVRVICEEEPIRPSTAVTGSEQRLAPGQEKPVMVTPQTVSRSRADTPAGLRRQLAGDADEILLKALRKDPAQRYASAAAFDEDVRRHLDGLPVLAQGESIRYRTGKFVRRHSGWSIGLAALVAGLATGTVRVSSTAVIVAVAFIATVALAYLVLRKEAGEGVAKHIFQVWPAVLACLAAVAFIVHGLTTSFRIERGLLLAMIWVPAAACVAAGGAAADWVRWYRRERVGGPLLADLSTQHRWPAYIWLVVMGLILAFPAVAALLRRNSAPWLAVEVIDGALAVIVVFVFVIYGKVEIRSRGIFCGEEFLRWHRVEGYSWEQPGGQFVILKLRARPPFFSVPVRTRNIIVQAGRRAAVDAALRNQLSEWPGGADRRPKTAAGPS